LSRPILQLNSEYTIAQTDRVKKEAAYESVLAGTLEAAQVSSQGEALRKISERVDEREARYAEVKAHYGSNHPEYRKALASGTRAERLLEQAKESTAGAWTSNTSRRPDAKSMLEQAVNAQKTGVRPPQRALVRISDPQARSRGR
jgi:hypothetical protein